MSTRRRRRFVHAQTAWTLGVVIALSVVDALTLRLVFVAALVGFLTLVELTAPINVTPAWRRRLRWLIGLSLVAFAVVILDRVLSYLPTGVG